MSRAAAAPHVYRAINAITAAMASEGIPRAHTNEQDRYSYRSIDDVLGRLAPLLATHRLCVLPRILKHRSADGLEVSQGYLTRVHVLIAYDLVSSRDGSIHTIKAPGEALDSSDKATAKAMSAAYKSAMLQTFCVPVTGGEDADAKSPRTRKLIIGKEPVQGWQAWADDIVEMIGSCETVEALDRIRIRQAALLTSISRERADLYASLGAAFSARMEDLATTPSHAVKEEHATIADTSASTPAETVDA
ncbi:MAG: ERF family protein [Pseudomonadota bacterium]